MKRLIALFFALVLVLSLAACNGASKKDGSEKDGNTYTAKHAHIYPVVATMDIDEYVFEIKGNEISFTVISIQDDAIAEDGGAVSIRQKLTYASSFDEKDGYYLLVAQKAYQSVEISGAGAESYRNEIKESINNAINDPDQSANKERNQQYLRMYEGETVDVSSLLPQGEQAFSFKIKVNKSFGKITELMVFQGETVQVTYTFTYDDNGALATSEEDYSDNRRYEADYRADGTPSAFRSVDSDGTTQSFTCDEEGNITEVE